MENVDCVDNVDAAVVYSDSETDNTEIVESESEGGDAGVVDSSIRNQDVQQSGESPRGSSSPGPSLSLAHRFDSSMPISHDRIISDGAGTSRPSTLAADPNQTRLPIPNINHDAMSREDLVKYILMQESMIKELLRACDPQDATKKGECLCIYPISR